MMHAYSEVYLEDVVKNQGELFDFVSYNFPNADTKEFIKDYMKSKTRKSIDEAQAYVNTMSADELWNYFLKTEHYILKSGKSMQGFMPDWIGEFYAYYQWYYGISSSEVIKEVSIDFLIKAYPGLHDLELDLAVKKVGESLRKIICFHNSDEENGYLSNWFPSEFTIDGIIFSSMEQFMMYKKATYFQDQKTADKILAIKDAAKIKKLGRGVLGYNDQDWNGVRQIIVYEGLLQKFSQNAELKKQLLDTKGRILAECAKMDCIWGIGLSMKSPDRMDQSKWKGQNLLGYTLMMVRERLS